MEEIWKDIRGYEGLYQISNLGRIKSLPKWRVKYGYGEIILKQSIGKKGYKVISLNKNKKRKQYKVHRLIAEAFIPNPENKPQINHIDGNKLNNDINNLEWCTQNENIQHAYNTGLYKNYSPPPVRQKRKIIQYSLDGQFIKYWIGIADTAKKLNCDYSNIVNCCRGKQKSAFGFIWKYAD